MNNSAAQTFRRRLNQQHHGSFFGCARKIDRKTHLEMEKEKIIENNATWEMFEH